MHRARAPRQRPHRRRRLAVEVSIGVLAAVASLVMAAGPAAATNPDLTTDSGGAPLMTGSNLRPGHKVENCMVLTYDNLPPGGNGIGMYGASSGSGLADYLDMTVEVGSGGVFGDCSGFSGNEAFAGTLSEFGQAHGTAASQLLLATVDGSTGSISIRVALRLRGDNHAQGRTASAAFSWTVGSVTTGPLPAASSVPAPSTSVPASPTPTHTGAGESPAAPSTSASSSPVGTREPVPSVTAVAGEPVQSQPVQPGDRGLPDAPGAAAIPSTAPAASGSIPDGPPLKSVTVPLLPAQGSGPSPSASPDASSDSSSGDSGSERKRGAVGAKSGTGTPGGAIAQIREAIKELVNTAQEAAPVAAKGGALGLGTLPFLLLFLLVQKRLDDRDPKLALAPSYEDDYLGFDDPAPMRDPRRLA